MNTFASIKPLGRRSDSTPDSGWGRGAILHVAAMVVLPGVLLAGCVTMQRLAPQVDGRVIQAAASDVTPAQLTAGRAVYLNQCARCHVLEPIDGYSVDAWEKILPGMSKLSKLTPRETQDLRAYILAARTSMPQASP